MKVLLYNEVVFKTDLTYKVACELLEKAEKSKVSDLYSFHMSKGPSDSKWKLIGRPSDITKKFLENPDIFVIGDDDETGNN